MQNLLARRQHIFLCRRRHAGGLNQSLVDVGHVAACAVQTLEYTHDRNRRQRDGNDEDQPEAKRNNASRQKIL
jgi:hypothetical protein